MLTGFADRLDEICDEVCVRHEWKIRQEIARRVRAEFGNAIKAAVPKASRAHATRWGPKVLDFPRVDPDVLLYHYALPLLDFEVKLQGGEDDVRQQPEVHGGGVPKVASDEGALP